MWITSGWVRDGLYKRNGTVLSEIRPYKLSQVCVHCKRSLYRLRAHEILKICHKPPWSLDAIPSLLDDIIDQLGGPSAVAEMTGRKGRMVRDSPNATVCYQPRTSSKSLNIKSLNLKEVSKQGHHQI